MFNGLLLSVDRVATILCGGIGQIYKYPSQKLYNFLGNFIFNIFQLLFINFYENYYRRTLFQEIY